MLPPPTQPATTGTQQAPASGADSLLIDMANAAAKEVILLEVKEVSVSIPQRKKYDLCFTKNYLYTKQVGTTTPVQGMVYDWSQIGMSLRHKGSRGLLTEHPWYRIRLLRPDP